MLYKKAFLLARSLLILYIMLYLGNLIAHFVPVGVPGSIWGLLVLFIGLTTQTIRLEWIYFGASLLIRFMAILFVPVSVGMGADEYFVNSEYRQHLYYVSFYRRDGKYAV